MKKIMKNKMHKAISSIFPPVISVAKIESSNVFFGEKEKKNTKEVIADIDTEVCDSPSLAGRQIVWNISEIKKKISQFADQGRISSDLTDILQQDGIFAPVEFECLDYKQSLSNNAYEKGKLVKRIVSFYNSYGGYLIFGVSETEAETRFDVVGMGDFQLDIESIKATIKEFTGERIQISPMKVNIKNIAGDIHEVMLLHIPKRSVSNPPLHFLKDGPLSDAKKCVFLKDTVYYRRGDECVEAKGPRILELNGDRLNPYLTQGAGAALAAMLRVNRISHNLPDRNFICPKFVGREKSVDALWRWLGDDLSHVKVLAGEGGLGKSSIAFEFAERVSETRNAPFDQVVWLTAKEQQFNAFDDKYVRVPERHYTSYEELLQAICERLPFTAEELDGATSVELRRMLKKGLSQVPSLIIIDDVDSLAPEEQRQVLELGMIVGGGVSRILLTTRFNQSYSLDTVIKISGFSIGDEFSSYIETLRERLEFPELKSNEVEKIHLVSGGSPLFTESLLRLLRWNSVGEAISSWKNERGSAVRAAALKREVELLSPEGQRILFTIAMLGEVSKVEICEVLGYTSDVVENGLSSLQSLFLVAAPALADVPRFRVPDNTRRLVLDPTVHLVTDRNRLQKSIEDFRRKNDRSPTRDSRIASAISQAESLYRVGDKLLADKTISEALRKTKDHPDLMCYQANVYMRENPPRADDARNLARSAFQKGCRKLEVFQCWFEAEWSENHYIGALEAAEAALENKSPSIQEWLIRKSAALASKASDQSKTGATSAAVKTMFEASEVLRDAISKTRRDDSGEWETRQAELHDQIWFWAGMEERGLGKTNAQIDALEKMWILGDSRITNLRRMLSAIEGMALVLERKVTPISGSQKNLFSSLLSRGQSILDLRNKRFVSDNRHENIKQSWDVIQHRAHDAVTKSGIIHDLNYG